MATARILIVGASPQLELLQQTLAELGYGVVGVVDTEAVTPAYLETVQPDLVLQQTPYEGGSLVDRALAEPQVALLSTERPRLFFQLASPYSPHPAAPADGIDPLEDFSPSSEQAAPLPLNPWPCSWEEEGNPRWQEPLRLAPSDRQSWWLAIEFSLYRHRMAAKLNSLEQWLVSTLNSVGDAVIATDPVGRVTFINPVAECITGWKQPDSLGKPVTEIFRTVDAQTRRPTVSLVDKALAGHIALGSPQPALLLTRDGSEVPVRDSAAPLRDEGGNTTGAVLVFRDISQGAFGDPQRTLSPLHDALTGLANRALFMDRLQRLAERAPRSPGLRFAVLFLDLNRFKSINDTLGHLVGDQLLSSTARRLEICLRTIDTVARLGGDEFAILLEGIQQISDATRVAERIHREMAEPFLIGGQEISMTVSIGIAIAGAQNHNPEQVLHQADVAMYRAKQRGSACYEVYDPLIHSYAKARAQWEEELRQAVDHQELRVRYQPMVSLSTGQIEGLEAFLAWQHPERGLVDSGELLSIAEETGLIVPAGEWLLQQVCWHLRQWRRQFAVAQTLRIHLNLGSRQLAQGDLVEQIATLLTEHELPPQSLCLEIPEPLLAQKEWLVSKRLAQFQSLGVGLLLDQFGSGGLSLPQLLQLGIPACKWDPGHTQISESLWLHLAQVTLTLAESLGMRAIAVGIDSEGQVAALRELGWQSAQGSYFTAPLPPEQIAALLEHPAFEQVA
ncbi:MAG: EAL domain-containing protein [Cyanobacteriota bacterium]|nr:EAL domain-containing protein [Cyanobacteriota bacterium]